MWDDVIIGKGQHICSAFKCYEGPDTKVDIKENQNSYWIDDLILGGSIKIFKDTVPGKKLTEMLEIVKTNGEYEYKIYNYLNRLFLRRIKTTVLTEIIIREKRESYEKGKEDKAREIRVALNMESNKDVYYLSDTD